MGDYDFTDSDPLDAIVAKIAAAEEALQLAKDEATRTKPTGNLQTQIQGKIDKLETRKKELQK